MTNRTSQAVIYKEKMWQNAYLEHNKNSQCFDLEENKSHHFLRQQRAPCGGSRFRRKAIGC